MFSGRLSCFGLRPLWQPLFRYNDKVIVELKAVDYVNPVWEAQIISHHKLTGKRLGYLVNFNVSLLKNGVRRYRN